MMTDRTYVRDFAKKKTYSVSATTLKYGDFSGTSPIDVFNLPEKSLIREVLVLVDVPGQSGLNLKVDVGDTTRISAAAVDTALHITRDFNIMLSETGKTVTVTPNAAPTSGEFTLIVEYVEYTLGNGSLTNYNDS